MSEIETKTLDHSPDYWRAMKNGWNTPKVIERTGLEKTGDSWAEGEYLSGLGSYLNATFAGVSDALLLGNLVGLIVGPIKEADNPYWDDSSGVPEFKSAPEKIKENIEADEFIKKSDEFIKKHGLSITLLNNGAIMTLATLAHTQAGTFAAGGALSGAPASLPFTIAFLGGLSLGMGADMLAKELGFDMSMPLSKLTDKFYGL